MQDQVVASQVAVSWQVQGEESGHVARLRTALDSMADADTDILQAQTDFEAKIGELADIDGQLWLLQQHRDAVIEAAHAEYNREAEPLLKQRGTHLRDSGVQAQIDALAAERDRIIKAVKKVRKSAEDFVRNTVKVTGEGNGLLGRTFELAVRDAADVDALQGAALLDKRLDRFITHTAVISRRKDI